ncbi:MAG: hypothetical protein EOL87_13345 [Spartobacteria bacterium]|nr:hypothetical protein [Spartobacteria bacterium]
MGISARYIKQHLISVLIALVISTSALLIYHFRAEQHRLHSPQTVTKSVTWPAPSANATDFAPKQGNGHNTVLLDDAPLHVEDMGIGGLQKELEHVQTQNQLLQQENNRLQKQLGELINWMLQNYRGRYPVPEHQLTNMLLSAINEQNFTPHNDLVEFLRLTATEQAMLSDAFQFGQEQLNQIIASNITVLTDNSGKTTLYIPPFPEEGDILKNDLYQAISLSLDPARFDKFIDVAEQRFNQSFYYFGEAAHTLVFEPIYIDESSPLQWSIKDAWIIQQDDTSRSVQAMESTVTNIPASYLPFREFLPEYMPIPD